MRAATDTDDLLQADTNLSCASTVSTSSRTSRVNTTTDRDLHCIKPNNIEPNHDIQLYDYNRRRIKIFVEHL